MTREEEFENFKYIGLHMEQKKTYILLKSISMALMKQK